MKQRIVVAALLMLLAGAATADEALDAAFPQSSIVLSASDACYRFAIYVAMTDQQRQRGLMHVRAMDDWRGMLFVYGQDARHSMWMKNTLIPLDMLFVRADGTISSIARDTEPHSLQSVGSIEPVRYVLELNAGTSDRLGLRPGDRLFWAGDVTPPSQD
jgi:uncharacterized protein